MSQSRRFGGQATVAKRFGRSAEAQGRNTKKMKTLHTATAGIDLGAGVALLCCPSRTVAVALLVGAPSETLAALTVARVGGGGLLALGIASWLARGDRQSRAARGLISAMVLYNLGTVVILGSAWASGRGRSASPCGRRSFFTRR